MCLDLGNPSPAVPVVARPQVVLNIPAPRVLRPANRGGLPRRFRPGFELVEYRLQRFPDHVGYINLDARKDRRCLIETQLDKVPSLKYQASNLIDTKYA